MSVIVTDRLTKRYGRRVGIEDLNLEVPQGAVFGFLGPNGSGKTTTIRLLLGFLRSDAGVGRVFGLDCWSESRRLKADVGYLPGDVRLYHWLTCATALRILGEARRCDLRPEGRGLAEDFGLDMDLPVRQMSRGTRQKLGLVMALAPRPRLLVLDEPSSGLDPLIQNKLFHRLRSLASHGHTVFFSSHTLSEVEELCDRVAILRAGKLAEHATLDSLRERAGRTVTILWNDVADSTRVQSPDCLTNCARCHRQWNATLAGSTVELMRWCVSNPVTDVTIGPPDLASLFRRYYDGGDSLP